MRVDLNLFASLRQYLPDKTGGTSVIMEIAHGATIHSLLQSMHVPAGSWKIVFLNGLHATGNEILKDGDRIGVFPPVAGG